MISHTKNPYKNLRFVSEKTLTQLFIISISFFSCYNTPHDLYHNKNEDELGFVFGNDLQSQNFYEKTNFSLVKVFSTELTHHPKLLQCCHHPKTFLDVQDAFLICLVPGFKVVNIDSYSPLVAKMLKDIIIGKFNETQICVVTKIFSRWGNFSQDNRDNETFQTQYFILQNQLDFQVQKLQKTYKCLDKIHVIFIGESYGGKISLFFLDQLLENLKNPKLVFELFITIHSPLHQMQMPHYALNSKFLNCSPVNLLTSCFGKLDLLNVKDYKTTFEILSSGYINEMTTIGALDNLKRRNIKIFNFIGTPREIHFGDTTTNFISLSSNLSLFKHINKNDTFITFLNDPDYPQNSDFVVKTSEITKDPNLIDKIKLCRNMFQIYQAEGMTFFVSPNIIHLGDVFNLDLFEKELQDERLLKQFDGVL